MRRGPICLKWPVMAMAPFLCFLPNANAQISLTAIMMPETVDFTGFTGTGFTPTPAAGQLDSDTFSVLGLSDGDLAFGGSGTTGDFARGTTTGGVTTGGVYAFNLGGGNMAFGVQPAGSDFTPGELILRVDNNTGDMVDEVEVTYDIIVRNDQGRANSFNFSHGTSSGGPFTAVGALDFTTTETADGAPSFITTNRMTTITGLGLANGASLFLRWTSDDVSGAGSRDEIGIDNIVIEATTVPVELMRFTIED